jgi:phage tail-like protein
MIESFPRDPLRTFQFRIGLFDALAAGVNPASRAVYLAGVQKASGLGMTVEANETWSGGNSLHRYANPHRVSWEPITLEQGLALSTTLEDWAHAAMEFARTGRPPDIPVKRNLFIDVWDPEYYRRQAGSNDGRRLRRYLVFNAWVSRFQALPQLDGMDNAVALLSLELVHEGWRLARADEQPSGFTQRRAVDAAPATN